MSQMEEAKADPTEVEKKVSNLLKFIQNQSKSKITKVTKKELVGIVKDLHEHCHLLYSVFQDSWISEKKGKSDSSSRSSSDLDYYSSEEIDISSDYTVMLRKIQETELTNEDLKSKVSNLRQETDQNMELAGDIEFEGKRNEDKEPFKGLMMSKDEVALLRSQKKELELKLEEKTNEVLETRTRLKRLEKETEERAKAEKEDLCNKVQKFELDMKSKIVEIDHLKEENQKLTMESKDQKKLLKEQKDAIDKFSEDQKLMKRLSFGSKLNTNLLERKMEELAEDFRMKMEDQIRLLYRRIHVAEQIHLESKNDYIKTRGESKGDVTVSETQFKKIKDMVEEGLAGPEMAIKKLEEGKELTTRVTKLAKEIDSAKKWVQEKKDKSKHEVETLEAKLECREAQECLLKEKLSKLEAKLGEEGTGKLSLEKAMRRIKKLEMNVKERDVELMSLGEEKREAIRQLCVLVDYQRCRYDDLKTSIFKVALQA